MLDGAPTPPPTPKPTPAPGYCLFRSLLGTNFPLSHATRSFLVCSPLVGPEVLKSRGNINGKGERCQGSSCLGECEGDCEADYHCADGLKCWQRTSKDPAIPPGTIHHIHWDLSFSECTPHFSCHHQDVPARHMETTTIIATIRRTESRQWTKGKSITQWPHSLMNTKYSIWLPIYISDNPGGNLKECEGDCDRNSQCEGRLQCYQRGTFIKYLPPGCKGQQFTSGHDFCFDPDKAGVNSMPPGTFSIFPANWSWCHLSGIALALYIDDRGQIRRKLQVVVWISINCGRILQVIWITMMYIIPKEELPVIGPIHVIPGITAPNTIPTRTVMMWLGMETTFLCSNTRPCGLWRWRCAPWLPLSWHWWFAKELRQHGKWCTGKCRLLIRIRKWNRRGWRRFAEFEGMSL